MSHGGTKRIETERLVLRCFEIGDAGQMYANWASDPVVTEFLTWPAHASEDVTRQVLASWAEGYARPDAYDWALELKRTGEVIGSLSVVRADDDIEELELGWCLGRAFWGRGLMPEAAAAVVDYLFDEVGARRICAKHDVDNPKSGRVMQKLGMRFEGVHRRAGRNNRGVVDLAVYALLSSDRKPEAEPELWDAYDRAGRRLDITLTRGQPVPDGLFHLVCEVAVRHVNGDFLLMLRDPGKPIHPGLYELTAGGSALKGEDPLTCVRRELFEETGIDCDAFRLLSVTARESSHCIFYAYCCETDCDPQAIRLQPGETAGWRWVKPEALEKMLNGGELVPSTRERIRGLMQA